jgi:Skp family chaperone for outer membrane proteins
MRNFSLSLFILLFTISTFAQSGLKIAYVDMDYILENVPEYQQASNQLNSKAQQWRTEIEAKQNEIDDLKAELETERPLLTTDLVQDMEDEINYLENQLLEYRNKRFGVSGDFIVQKRQLIQPIQDQVFNAIQEIGEERDYDFIFENSADALLLFSARRHDLSDVILKLINRNSRSNITEAPKSNVSETEKALDDMGDYKSVEKAKEDEVKEEERAKAEEARKQEREALINERQRKRDSLREARQKEFEARRAKILKERERREKERDSIRKARENN